MMDISTVLQIVMFFVAFYLMAVVFLGDPFGE